jgi:ketosteroid isomerase-like protein
VVPDESTTPDPVELARRIMEALGRGDVQAEAHRLDLSLWAPDSVWDNSRIGLGTFEGLAAIRRMFEDWLASYEEFESEVQELLELGNGVVFVEVRQEGRPIGSTGVVRLHIAWVAVFEAGMILRVTVYPDIDEARTDAQRLAQERG